MSLHGWLAWFLERSSMESRNKNFFRADATSPQRTQCVEQNDGCISAPPHLWLGVLDKGRPAHVWEEVSPRSLHPGKY